jgi:teichuronic acid biosynthesis glycosyltransferase TuaG
MSHQMPVVSIVVPAYNCAEYVEETFRSVLAQDFNSWEIIFVNDGSTDKTAEVLARLEASDSRVVVVHQANGRQGKARNHGIFRAKAEVIVFLDADDLWPANKLSYQFAEMQKSGADLIFTDGFICLNNQMDLREHRFGVEDKFFESDQGVQQFHAQNKVPTSSVMAKKSALTAVGGFPEAREVQNCEDYLLWTKMLANGFQLQGISEPLLFYRVHPESSTGQEINLLFPLVRALMAMPGNHGEALLLHLERSFIRLISMLNERGRIKELDSLAFSVPGKIYPGGKAILLKLAWVFSARIYLSLIWRMKRV